MERRRLVFFPLPFQGHISPMLDLAAILHATGFFAVSVVHTAYNSPDPANYPDFTFHRISRDGVSDSDDSADLSDVLDVMGRISVSVVEPFRRILSELSSQGDVACVITDVHWSFAPAVASEFRIPRIDLRTGAAASVFAFYAVSVLFENGYFNGIESKLEEPVAEFPPLRGKDLPSMNSGDPTDLAEFLKNIVASIRTASALVLNTFHHLESAVVADLNARIFPDLPIFLIGPFHKRLPNPSSSSTTSLIPQDFSSVAWLDEQPPRSVLYVSFGSLAKMDPADAARVAAALSDAGCRFLWAIRPGSIKGSEWIENVDIKPGDPSRCCVVKWAPQREVLRHGSVGGFWSHGGWNSTVESLAEGVPMICSPFFGDQMANSRYVGEVWKVGVMLEKGLEDGEVMEAAIRKVMEEDGEMRRAAQAMKTAADVCLRPGGSSHKALDDLVNFILNPEKLDT